VLAQSGARRDHASSSRRWSPHSSSESCVKIAEKKIGLICSLPEGRASKTPTIEQVLRLFEHQNKHALCDGERLVKQFADP
jgi:hypothetical protein